MSYYPNHMLSRQDVGHHHHSHHGRSFPVLPFLAGLAVSPFLFGGFGPRPPYYGPQYGPSFGPQYGPSFGPQYGPSFGPQYSTAFGPQYGPGFSSPYGINPGKW